MDFEKIGQAILDNAAADPAVTIVSLVVVLTIGWVVLNR